LKEFIKNSSDELIKKKDFEVFENFEDFEKERKETFVNKTAFDFYCRKINNELY